MGESRIAPTLASDFVTIKKIRLDLLVEVDLHTPKASKSHIKHELDAHLSTSSLLTFSSGIYQVKVLILFQISLCLVDIAKI